MASKIGSSEKEIVYEDLKEQLNNLLVIDVRDVNEIERDGKIPTSINIPLNTVKQALEKSNEEFESLFHVKKPHLDEKIVFHCHAGKRAAMAKETATGLGFSNALVYKGSFTDWLAKGGTIERK